MHTSGRRILGSSAATKYAEEPLPGDDNGPTSFDILLAGGIWVDEPEANSGAKSRSATPAGDPVPNNSLSDLEDMYAYEDVIEPTPPSTPASDRKSTRLNSSHSGESRMPSSA